MFCPIMTIGFDPPEKGKKDPRECRKDCTWYNTVEESCNLNVIATTLQNIDMQTADSAAYLSDMATEEESYDDFGDNPEAWNYYHGYR